MECVSKPSQLANAHSLDERARVLWTPPLGLPTSTAIGLQSHFERSAAHVRALLLGVESHSHERQTSPCVEVYPRLMRPAVIGVVALALGAAIGIATWIIELRSLPPGCLPCTTSVCAAEACAVDWTRLVAIAVAVGLTMAGSTVLAMRRWAPRIRSKRRGA